MQISKKMAISDSGFIFDPQSGESFSVNETGALIIKMVREGKSEADICGYFIKHFDVDEATFEKTYLDFVAMLRFYKLVSHE